MRKLKLQVQVSIDGFMAGPNDEMDWMEWNWDAALNQYITELTDSADTIVLGRKLADGFIDYWENMANNLETASEGRAINDMAKVVFSRNLDTVRWENTTLANKDFIGEINTLKSSDGRDIIAYGGSEFVSSLIKADLIDEYYLLVNPTAIGKGLTVFGELDAVRQLKLVEARQFDCGITLMQYNKINNQ